jgi:hypothetical protein
VLQFLISTGKQLTSTLRVVQ